jgi:large subunit ribosomal protein L10
MKLRQQTQHDLEALAAQFQKNPAAMIVGYNKLTVAKDQELRNQLREIGATYRVVKNTIARRAAEGTPFAEAHEHFKGMTALALSDSDPVALSKSMTKFVKANADNFTFKAGVVEGKVVSLAETEAIANLPSKEELISKVMFLINCQAQRLVTVLSAVPRNLAVVVDQIRQQKEGGATE